jgi:hypothetical protein
MPHRAETTGLSPTTRTKLTATDVVDRVLLLLL